MEESRINDIWFFEIKDNEKDLPFRIRNERTWWIQRWFKI